MQLFNICKKFSTNIPRETEMDSLGKVNKDGYKLSQISLIPQDIIQDKGGFNFWNGDRYEGEYLAVKAPLSIVREGVGTYWTSDDCVYKGCWHKDHLEKADSITFPDKSELCGTLENMAAEGPGTYKFKEGVEIHGFLINNQFAGDLELKDPTGHCWRSSYKKHENELFFNPVQPFWQSIININNYLLPYEADDQP